MGYLSSRYALVGAIGLSLVPVWGQTAPEPIKLGSVILSGSIRVRS